MLKSLKIYNFRNWKELEVSFDPITIFVGPNGIGKSNLLEAIVMVGTSRSHRTQFDKEIIAWGEDFSRLIATNDDKEKIELVVTKDNGSILKKLKINNSPKKIIDILGIMPVVIFSPDSMELITGSPSLRRRFLDIVLSQIDYQYAFHSLKLRKILKNRNLILQSIKMNYSSIDELNFWDKELIESGSYIFLKRIRLINQLNEKIKKFHQIISGTNRDLKIEYFSKLKNEREKDRIKDYYQELIKSTRREEIERGLSLIGPHRDNFRFLIDEKDSAKFASRGEIRTIVVALKIAELEFIKSPILLLDDVFSELDETRRRHLLELTSNQQTVIATTDIGYVGRLKDKARVVDLERISNP